jgi:hypothetical protein
VILIISLIELLLSLAVVNGFPPNYIDEYFENSSDDILYLKHGTFLTANTKLLKLYKTESLFLKNSRLLVLYLMYPIIVTIAIFIELVLISTIFDHFLEIWYFGVYLIVLSGALIMGILLNTGTTTFTVNNSLRMEKKKDDILLTIGGSYPVEITSPKQPVPLLYPYEDSVFEQPITDD